MSNRDLFNQKEFPKFKNYEATDENIKYLKKLWLNDIDLITTHLHEITRRARYFNDVLLYIQRKMYLDEPLELCLDSSKELFDIMITPCEILNDEGKELTLDDYNDVSEWTIERENKDDPISKQYILCKTCDFATDDTFKFAEHKCELDEVV